MTIPFRDLPSVDRVLSDERMKPLREAYPNLVTGLVRSELEGARSAIAQGQPAPSFDAIVAAVQARVGALGTGLKRVINATGIIIHTNLGRAPLSREAIEAMERAAQGYSNLEFDLKSGERGSRHVHLEALLCQATGAEAGFAVNNNAAAVLLGLSALARGREVIVSRGQAVEIGGGFRIPDVMRQSGARLVEVGTTNRTNLADYEQAITPRTAALLRVHTSNFKMIGFTEEVGIEELVGLGLRAGVPVLDDLGSGCLLDTTRFGLAPEPLVPQSIAAGVGLAFFSGDKLLGGPQAGIIAGKKALVEKLKRHPLARAVRVDKVTLAGLAATLLHYLKGEAETRVPVWRMIAMPLGEIEGRARAWAEQLPGRGEVVSGESMVGGGSLPGATLPTRLLAVSVKGRSGQAQELARRLRFQEPPVVGRIERNRLLFDPRTVFPEEDEAFLRALRSVLGASE